MGDTENPTPMSLLSLDVRVPCDGRYLPMLRQLAERTVEYIGYHEALRAEVVETIDQAVHGVFETDEPAYAAVELRLATTADDMLVRIRYLGAPIAAEGQPAIERLLSRLDGDEAPLARLRRNMKTVVVGREPGTDGADFCELTCRLPDEH